MHTCSPTIFYSVSSILFTRFRSAFGAVGHLRGGVALVSDAPLAAGGESGQIGSESRSGKKIVSAGHAGGGVAVPVPFGGSGPFCRLNVSRTWPRPLVGDVL